MIINEKTRESLPIDWDSYYVVADFDHTITSADSKSSWAMLAHTSVPEGYKKYKKELYDKYRPIEIDETMEPQKRKELILEWYKKELESIVEYQLKEEIFNIGLDNSNMMEFRNGAKEFIKFLHEKGIPLIIISAGIGNYIENFLKTNDIYFDNIYVASNIVTFKDGLATGLKGEIIHSFNKSEVKLPQDFQEKIKNRPNVLLLGDQTSDLNMVDYNDHDKVITVCFMNSETSAFKDNYKDSFDILIEEDEDYNTLFAFLERNN